MTTAAPPRPKFFASQRPGDPDCINAQAIRDAHWNLFGLFSVPGHEEEDFDATVTRLRTLTGFQPAFVRKAILAHAQLQQLPLLRALQAETRVLDMAHLTAVNKAVEELGADVEQEVLELIDELLVRTFTPKRANQELPQVSAVTRRIRDLVRGVAPANAYDPKARKRREDDADTYTSAAFMDGGRERFLIQLLTDTAKGELIHESVLAVAREHGTSMSDAACKLLTGEISPQANVVMHLYAPKDRVEGDPVYIPGRGWTDPEATATVEEWLKGGAAKTIDLDVAAEHEVGGYKPTAAMRAYAFARDGTCIYPGCSIRADRCQLDHRIPYDEGGATTPSNLFSLCARHHNAKTDRRAFYVPDPATGDIIWLFPDGTYTVVESDGLLHRQLTPTAPRWQVSLQSVRALRADIAAFNAKCHAILDRFDIDLNFDRARREIAELEEKYGLFFPIKFEMPEMPIPEPWLDEEAERAEKIPPNLVEPVEAPFPEDDDSPPGDNPFHEPKVLWDYSEGFGTDEDVAGMMSFEEKIEQLGFDDFAEGMQALSKLYGFRVWEEDDEDEAV